MAPGAGVRKPPKFMSIVSRARPAAAWTSIGRRVHWAHAAPHEASQLLQTQLLQGVQNGLTVRGLDSERVTLLMDDLCHTLQLLRLVSRAEEWPRYVEICRKHSVRELLHQDPFTRRAFEKPRGYAGDAELMDYIYGREEQWEVPEASSVGRLIFEYTTNSPATEGVRARRGFIADLLDRMAEYKHRPHVLSVAAGHLREASLAACVKRRRLGRFVALDADDQSLAEIDRCYGWLGVETVKARISRLLTQRMHLGRFDVIYSTGLFDYLDQRIGQRLISSLFTMLRPRGKLLVANFLPGVQDIGYMEAFMDWQLVYRTRQEMVELTAELPQEELREVSLFAEENENIVFLQITRN